jgi:hypothetical protein
MEETSGMGRWISRQQNFCFVLFLFPILVVSKYWGEFRVDHFFFNSIHSLYYLRLCFFSTLLVHQTTHAKE